MLSILEIGQGWLLGAIIFVLLVILLAFRNEVKEMVNLQLTTVRRNESKLLEMTTAMSAEIQLQPLLQKVMQSVTEILDAERSTLFLHDDTTGELWSKVAEGFDTREIRFPCNIGIAGSVFMSGETVNIKDAYADPRFNRAVDRKTGYRTKTILCIPVANKTGKAIGVVQVLNKRTGPFSRLDERRLKAFTAQAAVALENAQLFDEVVNIKNYNEAMLESMKTGVMTTDARGCIIKANSAALALFNAEDSPESLIGQLAPDFFLDANSWIATSVAQALQERVSDDARDVMLYVEDANKHSKGISVNVTTQPLRAVEDGKNGCLLVVEDITTEKRLRSTMSRYMPKELADQLLDDGEQALGGTLQKATILFSDIRAFTGFSERNGPQETVRMLNEYFGVMYEKITGNDGLLDKYIGDAMMAVFGVPFTCDRDADNAVAAAIDMMNCLTDFNHVRMKAGKESISIGIGVSTGEVVSGNIGSSKRMDYTVIGDGVNLAARLESATKVYRTPILVSEQTVKAMTTPLEFREIDRIRAKGQMEPVAIFEVLDGLKDTDKLGVLDQLDRFGEAMGLYRGMQWNDASTLFSEVHSACPSDHVTQVYLERCEYLATAPPSMDWDGIWTMNTK